MGAAATAADGANGIAQTVSRNWGQSIQRQTRDSCEFGLDDIALSRVLCQFETKSAAPIGRVYTKLHAADYSMAIQSIGVLGSTQNFSRRLRLVRLGQLRRTLPDAGCCHPSYHNHDDHDEPQEDIR